MSTLTMQAILSSEVQRTMTFDQFKSAVLMGLATLFVSIAAFMASSLWSLNEKMAVIVEKVATQGDLLKRHDEDIRDLRVEQRANQFNLGPQKEIKR